MIDYGDRITLPATVKGETGWLRLDIVGERYLYGVTMDESKATRFKIGSASLARHAQRAERAGIRITR